MTIGENSDKPLFSNEKIKTHAEMSGLTKVMKSIKCKKIKNKKMNLIVLRINKSGELCESAPCYHCTKILAENKSITINNLYFSRNDKTITCVKFNDWSKSGLSTMSKGWKYLNRK